MSKTPKRKSTDAKRPPSRVAPAAAQERQVPLLGDCLRSIRFKRRLSLADVSAVTGIARSTLSRVESNQLSLTYDKLVQLSRGLQIDLAELLSPPASSDAAPLLTRRAFSPAGAGKVLPVGSSTYRYMCTELSAKRMTPMYVEVRAQSVNDTNGLLAHPGEEFTFVILGRLQLHTEFYEPLVLETGASVYFDSTMRHTYVAMDDAPAQILCVCSVDDTTMQHSLLPSDQMTAATRPAASVSRLQRTTRSKGTQ